MATNDRPAPPPGAVLRVDLRRLVENGGLDHRCLFWDMSKVEATTATTATTTTTTTTNPFVGKNFSGIQDPKVTVARRLGKTEKTSAAAAAYKAPTEAAGAVYKKGDDYKPLQPGKNFWGPEVSGRRRHNIIGGWVE
jgi:hypothetical protein